MQSVTMHVVRLSSIALRTISSPHIGLALAPDGRVAAVSTSQISRPLWMLRRTMPSGGACPDAPLGICETSAGVVIVDGWE